MYAIISVIVKFQLSSSFQPVMEHGWRTSPGSQYLRTVDTDYHSSIQQVKSNFRFREAVQFLPVCLIYQ